MIETARLLIRPWRDSDRAPFAEMGQDSEVMAHLGPPQWRDESDAQVDRMVQAQAQHGFCFWALEECASGDFVGFCGLKPGVPETPIAGDIEIGWRLKRDAWGKGYAREAAEAVLTWGFANLTVPRIAAITVPDNVRSWGLMERLGMTRRPEMDFDHPRLPPGDRLRPHIVYTLNRP